MKLTTRSEYALLAMVRLARKGPRDYVSAEELCGPDAIPLKYLEQLLLALKRAGCLVSRKGPGGGYRLARPAREISLAEIVRTLDGALAATGSASRHFYEPTPIEREPALLKVFKDIRDQAARTLEATSLADVCGAKPRGGP